MLFYRFVNFTSNSEDLCIVFKDVEKLFRNPGYVLQQCAYINNLTHFRSAHLYIFKCLDFSRGMMSKPLFIIPDFFQQFPNELCYGYFRFEGNGIAKLGRHFSLPSQRNFPISFKPKVAIAGFFWKMQSRDVTAGKIQMRPLQWWAESAPPPWWAQG